MLSRNSTGSWICLVYAYFFDKTEAGYAYKRYAYKKKHVSEFTYQNFQVKILCSRYRNLKLGYTSDLIIKVNMWRHFSNWPTSWKKFLVCKMFTSHLTRNAKSEIVIFLQGITMVKFSCSSCLWASVPWTKGSPPRILYRIDAQIRRINSLFVHMTHQNSHFILFWNELNTGKRNYIHIYRWRFHHNSQYP